MMKMINRITGTEMWIADNRLDEYLARGHQLAPLPGGRPEKATPAEMAAVRKKRKK